MTFYRCISRSNFSKIASINPAGYFLNPCIRLKEYLDIPLFGISEIPFTPSVEDMLKAEKLFISKSDNHIKKIAMTIDPSQYPTHDLPEIAMIGQSNAGKSTLLKAMFRDVPVTSSTRIKTSKKPGSTKGAHFFQIGSKFCLVDMPGYGINQPAWFEEVIESYFRRRKNLIRNFFLIDSKKGFQEEDDFALGMLEKNEVPYVIVMTKIDLVSDSLLLRNLLHLKQIKDNYASVCCFSQIFMVSATTYEGLAQLQAYIAYITGNLDMDQSGTSG